MSDSPNSVAMPAATNARSTSTEPTPLPSLMAVLWLAWFSFREMSRRKRLLGLAMINLLPVLVVLAIRIWAPEGSGTAQLQLSSLTFNVIIPFLIPIAAMAVGIPAIGEQVDDGTIVFTWTRPIKRRAIFLGRLLSAQVVATTVMSGSLILCFIIMISNGMDVITWDFLKLYLFTFLIIALGCFVYSALFATMGTFFRKPVLPALLYTFGWEQLVSGIPARVQELSLRFHLQNLIEHPADVADDLTGMLGALLTQMVKRDPVPVLQSVAVLVGVTLVATALGIWILRNKEITN